MDVDGTLLPQNENYMHKSVFNWLLNAKNYFEIYLCSNNPSRNRIKTIANEFKIEFTCSAGKPSRKKLDKVLNETKIEKSKIAIIGDRIFTDILVGNRLGIHTILVKPIDSNGKCKENDVLHKLEKKFGSFLEEIQK